MHVFLGYLILGFVSSVLCWITNDPAESDLFLDLVFIWSFLVFGFVVAFLASFIAAALSATRPIGAMEDHK